MSSTFGTCKHCPGGSATVRLYGDGVCAYHLGNPPAAGKKRPKKELISQYGVGPSDEQKKKLLHAYYVDQLILMPPLCENGCRHKLVAKETWRLKAFVCHILPKKTFESVMLHPLNRWFGCLDCHHNYDDKGWSYAVTMKVWPVVAERFTQFMNHIKDTELRKLPDCFRVLMETPRL